MKRTAVLISIAICLLGSITQAENWCQWFDSGCQVFAHVNTKQLREIPMMVDLLNGQDKVSQFSGQIRQWTAVDLDSITDVWFGLIGEGDALVVVQGAFNLSVIRGTIGGIETFRITTPPDAEFAVMMPDEKNPGAVNMLAFVTDNIAVFGKPNRVEGFLQSRETDTKHPRHAELAGFERPTHMIDAVAFGFPNSDIPALLTQNLALARLTGDANTSAEISLTLEPSAPAMVDPLVKLGEGLVELYGTIQPELITLAPFQKALLGNAQVAGTPGAVVISTAFPLAMVRDQIAAMLGSGGGRP